MSTNSRDPGRSLPGCAAPACASIAGEGAASRARRRVPMSVRSCKDPRGGGAGGHWASGTTQRGLALATLLRGHVRQRGQREGSRRGDGSRASAAWRERRQAPILLPREQGAEISSHMCPRSWGQVHEGSTPGRPTPHAYRRTRRGAEGQCGAVARTTACAGVHPLAATPSSCRGPLLCVRRRPGSAPQRPGRGSRALRPACCASECDVEPQARGDRVRQDKAATWHSQPWSKLAHGAIGIQRGGRASCWRSSSRVPSTRPRERTAAPFYRIHLRGGLYGI